MEKLKLINIDKNNKNKLKLDNSIIGYPLTPSKRLASA